MGENDKLILKIFNCFFSFHHVESMLIHKQLPSSHEGKSDRLADSLLAITFERMFKSQGNSAAIVIVTEQHYTWMEQKLHLINEAYSQKNCRVKIIFSIYNKRWDSRFINSFKIN